MELRSLLCIITLCFITACSSSQPIPLETVKVELDGSSRDHLRSRSFFLKLSERSLQDAECEDEFRNALIIAGYRPALLEESAELKIDIAFTRENPITGISLFGKYTPYHHVATLTAKGASSIYWVLRASAEGSEDDKRPLCPYLAAASIDVFGQVTNGKKTVEIRSDDSRVLRILHPEKKAGLFD